MSNVWEAIDDFKTDDGKWRVTLSDRLQVPGGWIVRSRTSTLSSDGGVALHQVFVSDPQHEWTLERS